jgi:hypothetical protein
MAFIIDGFDPATGAIGKTHDWRVQPRDPADDTT